jgi:hypothetical protein
MFCFQIIYLIYFVIKLPETIVQNRWQMMTNIMCEYEKISANN